MANRSNRSRILYIHHDTGIGGASNSLIALLQGIDRNRYVPLVVLPGAGPMEEKLVEMGVETVHAPIATFYHMEHFKLKAIHTHIAAASLIAAPGAAAWAEQTAKALNVSLVHVNGSMMPASAVGAHRAGVPVVWHVREILSLGSIGARHAVLNRLMKRNAAVVVAVSQAVAARLNGAGDVRVIYNGIDTESYISNADPQTFRTDASIPGDVPLIGYLSPIYGAKGCYDFVEVARIVKQRLPNAHFLVAGKTPEKSLLKKISGSALGAAISRRVDGVDRMRRMVDDYGLTGSFHFVGHRPETASIFGALDVLVFPSINEALGRVLLEAGAMSCPAVAYDSGGTLEVIDNGRTGLVVEAGAIRKMADAAVQIISNRALAETLRIQAQQRINLLFSRRQYVESVQTLYDELIFGL